MAHALLVLFSTVTGGEMQMRSTLLTSSEQIIETSIPSPRPRQIPRQIEVQKHDTNKAKLSLPHRSSRMSGLFRLVKGKPPLARYHRSRSPRRARSRPGSTVDRRVVNRTFDRTRTGPRSRYRKCLPASNYSYYMTSSMMPAVCRKRYRPRHVRRIPVRVQQVQIVSEGFLTLCSRR